jgi:hypothetical protein
MKNKKVFMKLVNMKIPLHENFHFKYYNNIEFFVKLKTIKNVHNCGTAGCLIGNLPRYDSNFEFVQHTVYCKNTNVVVTASYLCDYFDLPINLIKLCFFPDSTVLINYKSYNSPFSDATLKEVQKNIKFLMLEFPEQFIES